VLAPSSERRPEPARSHIDRNPMWERAGSGRRSDDGVRTDTFND